MKTTAGILVYKRRIGSTRVLLVFNGKHWSIPKGSLGEYESSVQAATRKLMQETQLSAPQNLIFIGAVKKSKHEMLTCFAGEFERGKPHTGKDSKNVRFVELSRAVKLVEAYQIPLLEFLGSKAAVAA